MNWTLIWLLNLIGIIVFFFTRYHNRTVKTIGFSWSYWLKDNLYELVVSLLLNIAAMIIFYLLDQGNALDKLIARLPEWLQATGIPGLSLVLGIGGTWAVYTTVLKKIKAFKNAKD